MAMKATPRSRGSSRLPFALVALDEVEINGPADDAFKAHLGGQGPAQGPAGAQQPGELREREFVGEARRQEALEHHAAVDDAVLAPLRCEAGH